MISPILEKLTGDTNIKTGSGRSLDLVTVDTDKELELAHKYQVSHCIGCLVHALFMPHGIIHVLQIRSLPTVMAFKDGKPVHQFIGALSEGDIKKFLQRL